MERGAIRAQIERMYADGVAADEHGNTFSIQPAALTADRGKFLRDMCLGERASRVLEIGMAWALSTLHTLEALTSDNVRPQPLVVTDPFQSSTFHNAGLKAVRDAGAESLIEFHHEPSYVLLPKLLTEQRSFDLIFVDASHRFDETFVELFYSNRLLKPGGVIVFDDTWDEQVRLVCQFAESNYRYSFVDGHRLSGRPGRGWLHRQKPKGRPMIAAYRKALGESSAESWRKFVPFYLQSWERTVTRKQS